MFWKWAQLSACEAFGLWWQVYVIRDAGVEECEALKITLETPGWRSLIRARGRKRGKNRLEQYSLIVRAVEKKAEFATDVRDLLLPDYDGERPPLRRAVT